MTNSNYFDGTKRIELKGKFVQHGSVNDIDGYRAIKFIEIGDRIIQAIRVKPAVADALLNQLGEEITVYIKRIGNRHYIAGVVDTKGRCHTEDTYGLGIKIFAVVAFLFFAAIVAALTLFIIGIFLWAPLLQSLGEMRATLSRNEMVAVLHEMYKDKLILS